MSGRYSGLKKATFYRLLKKTKKRFPDDAIENCVDETQNENDSDHHLCTSGLADEAFRPFDEESPEFEDSNESPTSNSMSRSHSIGQQESTNDEALNENIPDGQDSPGRLSKKRKKDVSTEALAFATLSAKHNLTNSCVDDLLLLAKHCGTTFQTNSIPTSRKSLDTILNIKQLQIEMEWICPKCKNTYFNDIYDSPYRKLKCEECNVVIKRDGDIFLLFDLQQILSLILPRVTLLQVDQESHISGKMIQSLRTKMNMNENDVTLTVNTDGVPLFKSSKYSLWPVLALINELHASERKQTVLLLGIWIGSRSGGPEFSRVLPKIIEKINICSLNGFSWKTKANVIVKTRVFVLCVLCDSIARPHVQLMSQFNAKYGCSLCYCKSNPLVRSCYFEHEEPPSILRCHNQHVKDCENAEQGQLASQLSLTQRRSLQFLHPENCELYGVKGFSPFAKLDYFDLILGFPPDIMHCVDLGVVRQLSNAWFDDNGSPYYLSQTQKTLIDEFLVSIKPPRRVSRVPRSLSENRKHYKAHEWRMWLLYYSPIILKYILPNQYYNHWMKLVKAISILTSKCVTTDSVQTAEDELTSFSKDMKTLYGQSACTFNVHLLLHLPKIADSYGPLQHITMSVFENYNGILSKWKKGSQYVAVQIAKSYARDLIIKNEKFKKNVEGDSTVNAMLDKKMGSPSLIRDSIKFFDAFRRFGLTEVEKNLLANNDDVDDDNFQYFKRAIINNQMFHSSSYFRVVCKDSASVLLKNKNCFKVNCFMASTTSDLCMAIGTSYVVETSSEHNLNYFKRAITNFEDIVPLDLFQKPIMHINYNFTDFFIEFVNDDECNNE